MPLYSDHISNMYYSGTPSYTSSPYSYSSSLSPLGTSYSASYLNPGGSYSKHSSLSSYSRTPLTSRWIPGLSRNYSPMLTPISERGTSSPIRINSPRRIPISKRSYGNSGYTQRPININTENIDVSRDKYRRKASEEFTPTRISSPKSKSDDEEKSPFMPRVDDKSETDIESSPGTQRGTIKRGRTVVRLHTVKRKERDSPRKPIDTPQPKSNAVNERNLINNIELEPESKSWRAKLANDLAYKGEEKKEKKSLGTKHVEKFIVKEEHNKKVETNLNKEESSHSVTVPALPHSELPSSSNSIDRRCSMELLAEQACLLDSLIRRENLSTATIDLTKVGVAEEPENKIESIKRKRSKNKENPLKTTKSDNSLHDNIKALENSKDSKSFSKRRSLKKSFSGGSICRLDSITELPKDQVQPDLPVIEEIRTSIKLDKTEQKPKLKTKITASIEISPPTSPLRFRIENITVEEKHNLPKKEITYSSTVGETPIEEITLHRPLRRTKERHSIKKKSKEVVNDSVSPEPDDGNFWNKIGKRETVYLIKRKQNIEDAKEKRLRSLYWFPEDEELQSNEANGNNDLVNDIPNENEDCSTLLPAITKSNIVMKEPPNSNNEIGYINTQVNTCELSKNDSDDISKQLESAPIKSTLNDEIITNKEVGSKSEAHETERKSDLHDLENVSQYINKDTDLQLVEIIKESNTLPSILEFKAIPVVQVTQTQNKLEIKQKEKIHKVVDIQNKSNIEQQLNVVDNDKNNIKEATLTLYKNTETGTTLQITPESKETPTIHEGAQTVCNYETDQNTKELRNKNISDGIASNDTPSKLDEMKREVIPETIEKPIHPLPDKNEMPLRNTETKVKEITLLSKTQETKDVELETLSKNKNELDKKCIDVPKSNPAKDKNFETIPKKSKSTKKSEHNTSIKKVVKTEKPKAPVTDEDTSNAASSSVEKNSVVTPTKIAAITSNQPKGEGKNIAEMKTACAQHENSLLETAQEPTSTEDISNTSSLPKDAIETSVPQTPITNEYENIPKTTAPQNDLEQVQISVTKDKKTEGETKAESKTEELNKVKQPALEVCDKLPLSLGPRKPVKEEKALKPLIATPRPLQKRAPQIIHSSESSDSSSEEDDSSEGEEESDTSEDSTEFYECENNADGRTSTGSNDSGFDSSAPTSPAMFLQIKKGGGDSPGPSSSNASAQLPATDILEQELEQSTAYGLFRKTGRFTPPARSIPRFRKYTVEDFQFIKVLGKGSFGKVLLAELRDTEYYYAVKCLKKDVVLEDDDVECTLIERKVLALGTNHPYLCHLFATFQTDSHLFFVMEYLNGGDLMFHIQQSGRFPEARARFYGAEIVSGLKFLHKRGIVYRDLKLDNILLDFDGHVRIADFGMCKLQIYLEKTADTFCGTPDYMAPEIIKGLKYNQTVDWWSFGVLLYEMLIGQSPFSGCDEDELFWSICNEMPSYPRFLSQEALTILTRLLDKDARTRLGGAECMHGDIREQEFFHSVHWDRLERRELEAPFRPRVRHPLDTQYFDRAFTGERPRLTAVEPHVLRSMDQEPFRGFSYTNPNATDR